MEKTRIVEIAMEEVSDADSVEFLCVTHEAHPGQIWSAEKVAAVAENRPLIDAAITEYQRANPNWKDQNISEVTEEITNRQA